jgi:hypothetical protein
MPSVYKILGTQRTSTNDVYTVPSSTEAVVSTIFICNRGATAATYSISVRPTAATTEAIQHFIVSGVTIPGNDTVTITAGIALSADNTIKFTTASSNLSISAFGTEIT